MTRFGLIGYPLTHSFSQKYFTEKFAREGIADCRYDLFEMPVVADQLPDLLKLPGLRGLNVTIPHKQAVLPYLDRLDTSAEKVGAVNVIRIEKDGSRTGFNSDYYGFRQSLEEWGFGAGCRVQGDLLFGISNPESVNSGFEIPNSESSTPHAPRPQIQALILGTGGASKAVVAALTDMGVNHKMVSRTKNADNLTYDELHHVIADYQLIVNCSPVGTYPNVDQAPNLPYDQLTSQHWLYDLVYNPAETLFMKKGKEQGANTLNGYRMLVLQAEKSWEIWQ